MLWPILRGGGSCRPLRNRAGVRLARMWGCARRISKRAFTCTQPTISHHMAILTKAGVVEGKKIGLWVWYRRNEGALREFGRTLTEDLCSRERRKNVAHGASRGLNVELDRAPTGRKSLSSRLDVSLRPFGCRFILPGSTHGSRRGALLFAPLRDAGSYENPIQPATAAWVFCSRRRAWEIRSLTSNGFTRYGTLLSCRKVRISGSTALEKVNIRCFSRPGRFSAIHR